MNKKKLKKEELEVQLVKVRNKLFEASIIADKLSRQVKNFEDSKPLNVLYKELNDFHLAIGIMCGRIKKPKEKELGSFNFWRIPDCLKVWLANH